MGLLRTFLSLGLLFGLCLPNLSAQSLDGGERAPFLGVWVMDAGIQMQKNSLAERNSQSPLDEQHRRGQLETMGSRTYIFHEGGEFESAWVSRGSLFTVAGRWQQQKDGTLEIKLEDGATFFYSMALDKRNLSLLPAGTDNSQAPELHLKRVEP